MIRLCERVLKQAGHLVTAFRDGRAAIERLRREAADLLITDIFMPEMEGLETMQHAHALYPAMPIIAVSGGGSLQLMEYLRFARRFGAIETLQKPFRATDLLAVVTPLLRPPPEDPGRAR